MAVGPWECPPGGGVVLYLSFSEHPASSELLGEGRGTADGPRKPGLSGLHLEPLPSYTEELGNE